MIAQDWTRQAVQWYGIGLDAFSRSVLWLRTGRLGPSYWDRLPNPNGPKKQH